MELLLFTIIGLSVGSFLTVFVERYDTMESAWTGRSHCNHCKKKLAWYELIPLFSFLLLQGKCRDCNKRIPHIYPIFEVITAISFFLVRWSYGGEANYWLLSADLLVVALLLALAFYDWLNQSFPVSLLMITLLAVIVRAVVYLITHPAIVAPYVHAPLFSWLNQPRIPLMGLFLGTLTGAILLGLLAFPSKGKWMGYGDVFMIAILGLWVGYPFVLFVLLGAFYAGAIIGGYQLISKRVAKDHRLAFGPFLIAASIVVFVWGPSLLQRLLLYWGAI